MSETIQQPATRIGNRILFPGGGVKQLLFAVGLKKSATFKLPKGQWRG